MIKVNELRIGNIIATRSSLRDGSYFQVAEIKCDSISTHFGDGFGLLRFHHLMPVPLTPEWLATLGFSLISHFEPEGDLLKITHAGSGLTFEVVPRHNFVDISRIPKLSIRKLNLDYVHQLQNLFFVLTGEELTVIPSKNTAG